MEHKASNLQEIETGEGGRKREGGRRKEKEREHAPGEGLSWKLRVEDGGGTDLSRESRVLPAVALTIPCFTNWKKDAL